MNTIFFLVVFIKYCLCKKLWEHYTPCIPLFSGYLQTTCLSATCSMKQDFIPRTKFWNLLPENPCLVLKCHCPYCWKGPIGSVWQIVNLMLTKITLKLNWQALERNHNLLLQVSLYFIATHLWLPVSVSICILPVTTSILFHFFVPNNMPYNDSVF